MQSYYRKLAYRVGAVGTVQLGLQAITPAKFASFGDTGPMAGRCHTASNKTLSRRRLMAEYLSKEAVRPGAPRHRCPSLARMPEADVKPQVVAEGRHLQCIEWSALA